MMKLFEVGQVGVKWQYCAVVAQVRERKDEVLLLLQFPFLTFPAYSSALVTLYSVSGIRIEYCLAPKVY